MVPSWLSAPLLASPIHNEFVGALTVARLIAACRLAPRRHRMATARGLAFTAAVRVVHRIHRHTAVVRTLAHPALAAGLADRDVLVVEVADLADRRHAVDKNLARLAGR